MAPSVRPLVTYGIAVGIVEHIECFKLGRVLRNLRETLITIVKNVWEGLPTNSTLLQRVNSMCKVLLLSELLDIPDKGSTRYASERILDTGLWVLVEVELGLNMVN